MRVIRPIATAISSFLVCACAPLQQAPLLYTSKVIIGAEVSANTTESPGASVHVGIKALDSAYVPVAVSKTAYKKSDGLNNDVYKDYPIQMIEAIYGEGVTDGSLKSLTLENQENIKKYLKSYSSLQEAERLKLLLLELEELKTKKTNIENQINTEQSDTDKVELINKLTNISNEIMTKKTDIRNYSTYPNKKLELTNKINQLQAETEELFRVASKAASLLRTDKRDAMSVYGRFDSDTESRTSSANNASVGLTAGKIFSTGVASQNLTEAVKIEAYAKCISDSVRAGELAKDDSKEIVKKLTGMCERIVSNNQKEGS